LYEQNIRFAPISSTRYGRVIWNAFVRVAELYQGANDGEKTETLRVLEELGVELRTIKAALIYDRRN
jgi:hypothetical protein